MARTPRVLIPGSAYHVTARGNHRQQIFFSRSDYALYLTLLELRSQTFGLEVLGWCLMPNHVHLLVREARRFAMANAIRSVHGRYAAGLNRRLGQASGHLWQGRYYSCPVPSHQIWTVLRYIELNPVRAGLTSTARDFEWSSARFHLGITDPTPLLSLTDWSQWWTSAQWREALESGVNGEDEAAIRRATTRGRWQAPQQPASKAKY